MCACVLSHGYANGIFISLYTKLKAKYNHLTAKKYLYIQPKRRKKGKKESQKRKEIERNGTEEERVFVCSLSTV